MAVSPTWKLRLFGLLKIPLIGFVRPRVDKLDDDNAVIRIPLNRRTKNHWGSMYFGALAIGADLAAATHAKFATDAHRQRTGENVGFLFKDIEGKFLRRPTNDVEFTSSDGKAVSDAVQEAARGGQRVNLPVHVNCMANNQQVATFTLTLSLKRK